MKRMLLVVAVVVFLAAPHANGEDAKKLEGTSIATSWKRGENEVPKDKLATELVISKDRYEYPTGINRISKKGTLKIDAAKGTIDFTPEDGPAKGKTLVGLYKIEGDKLTICVASADKERPKELKTSDRSIVLATYERKK